MSSYSHTGDGTTHCCRQFQAIVRLGKVITAVTVLALVGCSGSNDSSGSTPLTAAPGIDDEPLPESEQFNNAVGFAVTREPGPRLPPVVPDPEITEEEFAQGLPAALISGEENVDTSMNRPPFFSGLQNVSVEAGEQISIVYAPEDPDGGLPGMFPQELPQGASFDDNFDGTKTFNWQPLQMDVGILKLVVVATDPANGDYRTSQPLLIKVTLPDNPETIPNVAPMLEPLLNYTVKINDPVVIELKGIDLNGTVPTLQIPQLPPGGSFNQHPRFEEVSVLKFQPTSIGEVSIDVLLRDADDMSLIATESISINVLPDSGFQRPGLRLRALAQSRNVLIGFAASQSFYHRPDGALYADLARQEFTVVTPENSMKMDTINPLPGRYQFAATDNLIAFAESADMQVRGHPLLWHRQLPAWVEQSPVTDRRTHQREYISRILERYADSVSIWDVVNEPIDADGSLRNSIWTEAMGESYIDEAFNQVRALDATATLLINEFDIAMAGAKFDGLMQLVDRMQTRGTPLDAIGFQMHLFSSFNTFDELRENFAAVANRGLEIHITELDVSLAKGETLQAQADVYQQVVAICLEFEACKAIQMWGFTDQYSFRSIFDPLPFDRAYQAKPAYQALQQGLQRAPETTMR